MSIVPKETIEVIAQSIGINSLSTDAALSLAPDVEYRMREIMQEAIKCMRHSKRTTLTTEDVDGALKLRNVESLYGFASGGPLRFRRAIGHSDLFYLEDKDVDFKDVIEAPLPKAPLDTSIICHWLAIEGVQPAIPENAPLDVIAPPSDGKSNDQQDGLPVNIKLPVRHILSRELQLYFDKITELTVRRSDSVLFKEALVSLATDSGLHPLVPYFTYFVADEVSRGLNDYSLLFALMRVVRSLLQNPHIHIEPYLHQLMPSVVTCLVARRMGNRLSDNHWELRDFTASLGATICKRFGHVYNTLQPRLTKTLLNALLDPKKALTQHYGAIQGLAALGPNVVRLLVLPILESYMHLLEPEMLLEKQKNEVKRYEAWRVYGALLHAAGQCIYDRLKFFPPPSPPDFAVQKINAKVITSSSLKRKASLDQVDDQLPSKRVATDGPNGAASTSPSPPSMQEEPAVAPTGAATTSSSPSPMQEETAVVPIGAVSISSLPSPIQEETAVAVPSGNSVVGTSQSPGQTPSENKSGSKRVRERVNPRAAKMSAILPQIWKDDLNSGQILVSLFNLFGEGILSFIPAPEMSLFL